MKKKYLTSVGFLIIQILFVEILLYNFLPDSLISFSASYRKPLWVQDAPLFRDFKTSAKMGIKSYPIGYFKPDQTLGVDISPNFPSASFSMADAKLEVFSNDLGCFDRNSKADYLKHLHEYDYFAGDSFTWGYTNYSDKFATIYELETGRISLKCGVTNTGTLHQFEKFKNTISELGQPPSRVIVGYFMNDPDNDAVFPHSTVIEGYMVDTFHYRGKIIEPTDLDEISKRIEVINNAGAGKVSLDLASKCGFICGKIVKPLKKYSLIYNLTEYFITRITQTEVGNIYAPSTGGWYNFKDLYLGSPYTQRNQQAIRDWKRHSLVNSYELIFVLIPPKEYSEDTKYYSDLKRFLDSLSVKYLDLSSEFKTVGNSKEKFYWSRDGHLNPEGNHFVGHRISQYFR